MEVNLASCWSDFLLLIVPGSELHAPANRGEDAYEPGTFASVAYSLATNYPTKAKIHLEELEPLIGHHQCHFFAWWANRTLSPGIRERGEGG